MPQLDAGTLITKYEAGKHGNIHQERVVVLKVFDNATAAIQVNKPGDGQPPEPLTLILLDINTSGMEAGDIAPAPGGTFCIGPVATRDGITGIQLKPYMI